MATDLNPNISVFPDLETLSQAVARTMEGLVQETVTELGRFTLALSGGNTPKRLYEILANAYRDRLPWDRIHLFWGDERFVASNHRDSNFAMAETSLISKVSIPPENIHPIDTTLDTPNNAAIAYENALRAFFVMNIEKGFPRFDLVLLGLGSDGHTASLFPGSPLLKEDQRWVTWEARAPTPPNIPRITLTLPTLNAAKRVYFLATGEDKRVVFQSVMAQLQQPDRQYPVAMIDPLRTQTHWFVDHHIAG